MLFCGEPQCTTCRILVPRPEMEPMHPAVEAQILNHWTAREVLYNNAFNPDKNSKRKLRHREVKELL